MIVARIELWPGGDPTAASTLGILLVRNTQELAGGEGVEPDHFYYDVELQTDGRRSGRKVTHYRRRGWKVLLRKAVEAVL